MSALTDYTTEAKALAIRYKAAKGNWQEMIACHVEMVRLWEKYHCTPRLGWTVYDGRPKRNPTRTP